MNEWHSFFTDRTIPINNGYQPQQQQQLKQAVAHNAKKAVAFVFLVTLVLTKLNSDDDDGCGGGSTESKLQRVPKSNAKQPIGLIEWLAGRLASKLPSLSPLSTSVINSADLSFNFYFHNCECLSSLTHSIVRANPFNTQTLLSSTSLSPSSLPLSSVKWLSCPWNCCRRQCGSSSSFSFHNGDSVI